MSNQEKLNHYAEQYVIISTALLNISVHADDVRLHGVINKIINNVDEFGKLIEQMAIESISTLQEKGIRNA